jgi:hypothetical protein
MQLLHRHLFAAAVRADLGHQQDLVATSFEGPAQPFLAAAVVVFPGVVEEAHACVDGLVDQADGVLD